MARFLRFLNTRFCCCSCCSFSYVRNLNIRHALFTFEPSHFFVSSSPQLPQIWFFVAYLLLFIPQWNWFLQLLFQWNDGKIKQKMKWNPIHGFTWVIHFLVFAHSFFFFVCLHSAQTAYRAALALVISIHGYIFDLQAALMDQRRVDKKKNFTSNFEWNVDSINF